MDGKTYWKTNQAVNPNDPAQNILYFYFNVDDDFAGDLSDQDVLVTAEYYDQGNGDMVLQYDSKQSAFKDAPLFSYENSGTWKTHTFKLSDARFENRTNGADFRIGVTGAGAKAQNPELYLAKVTVTKQIREPSGTHETKVYDTVYPTDDIVIADRSVTDYGAKGDGSADDTRAFQEALADAGSQVGRRVRAFRNVQADKRACRPDRSHAPRRLGESGSAGRQGSGHRSCCLCR
ncbi:glycoside hydrolase family 55 protein [Paenibacillus sp. AR247]|uniref:glycoside hydrolase family 55 protein n=1 Tax=Paenibacillus sp. AR247 TaxID=1631599 RepID=UPI00215826A4|nr:glycoside hydrolase family 55 protein [Paenibacillus sp. AR247]